MNENLTKKILALLEGRKSEKSRDRGKSVIQSDNPVWGSSRGLITVFSVVPRKLGRGGAFGNARSWLRAARQKLPRETTIARARKRFSCHLCCAMSCEVQ